MKKRCLIAAAFLALCASLTLGVLALLPSRPGVTKANFDRIEIGMTEAEVETLFTPPSQKSVGVLYPKDARFEGKRMSYVNDDEDGHAKITFDINRRVEDMKWEDWGEQSFLERLRRLLHF